MTALFALCCELRVVPNAQYVPARIQPDGGAKAQHLTLLHQHTALSHIPPIAARMTVARVLVLHRTRACCSRQPSQHRCTDGTDPGMRMQRVARAGRCGGSWGASSRPAWTQRQTRPAHSLQAPCRTADRMTPAEYPAPADALCGRVGCRPWGGSWPGGVCGSRCPHAAPSNACARTMATPARWHPCLTRAHGRDHRAVGRSPMP